MKRLYEIYVEAYDYFINKHGMQSDRAHDFALKVMELEHNKQLKESVK